MASALCDLDVEGLFQVLTAAEPGSASLEAGAGVSLALGPGLLAAGEFPLKG